MTSSSTAHSRYTPTQAVAVADDWTLERRTPASRLYCANGLRTGADGRIYVAQVGGSQISAIDPDTAAIETISPMGGDIVGPDDLAFDDEGNLYVTEITEGRVSMLAPDGTARVLRDDMPVANPITYYRGRLIAGECRPGARILELDRNGGVPRVILDNVPMANAFEVGPDGKLYFPVMGTNEIWRVALEGGRPEVVARDLGMPDSVKFDPRGQIVSTQAATGQVLRIDPQTGARTVLATIAPGLDNCTFVGNRLFVSSISGQINEVLEGGALRSLIPDGLQWPLGLAVAADGTLFIADGGFTYTLRAGGEPQPAGMLFSPGFPGYTRGVAAAGPGQWLVTTANGTVARFFPDTFESQTLASGFEELYGVATRADGTAVFVDKASGRLLSLRDTHTTELARSLEQPTGVALAMDDSCYVAESGAGRVSQLSGGRAVTVLDGLLRPQGVCAHGQFLYVVDAGARQVIEYDPSRRTYRTIASGLPVGVPDGVRPKPLRAFPPLCGAMGPFAGIAADTAGNLYVSGDAEGSVLMLRRRAR